MPSLLIEEERDREESSPLLVVDYSYDSNYGSDTENPVDSDVTEIEELER